MRSVRGIGRAMRKMRRPKLREGGLGRPPRDPEGDERRHVRPGRHERHAGDAREAVRGRARERGRALVRPREPDEHREPADAARERGDRRLVEPGRLEPSRVRPEGGPAGPVGRRGAEVARDGRLCPRQGPLGDDERPGALRSEEPLLARGGIEVRPDRVRLDGDRTGGLGSVDRDGDVVRAGELDEAPRGEDRAGAPEHVREREEPRPAAEGELDGGERPVVVPAVADVHDVHDDPSPVTDHRERAGEPGVLVAGRHDAVAGTPVDRPDGGVHALRRRPGERDAVDGRPDHGRDHAARLVHADEQLLVRGGVRAPDRELPLRHLGGGARRLAGNGTARSRVEVDARGGGGQLVAQRADLDVVGEEGGHHGSV